MGAFPPTKCLKFRPSEVTFLANFDKIIFLCILSNKFPEKLVRLCRTNLKCGTALAGAVVPPLIRLMGGPWSTTRPGGSDCSSGAP